MEKWKDNFNGQIPQDTYTLKINHSEEEGLKIILDGENNQSVSLDFGAVSSYRVFDEGVLLSDKLFDQNQIELFKKNDFQSVLYEIENGKFSQFINDISNGIFDLYEMKHYLIITLNYVIEIATSFEPTIEKLTK